MCHELIDDPVPGMLQSAIGKQTGNLLTPDYRFFIGAPNAASKFSMCRACRRPLHSVEDRRVHLDRFKCSVWLVEAYKVLNLHHTWRGKSELSKRCCISCSAETGQAEWGVPLCGKDGCRAKWMFSGLANGELTNALMLVFPEKREYLERSKLAWEKLNNRV